MNIPLLIFSICLLIISIVSLCVGDMGSYVLFFWIGSMFLINSLWGGGSASDMWDVH